MGKMGKEVQKRWRSIRDSYTKMYRQGKCVSAEQCTVGSRRYNYHKELAFLKQALMNKKPRYSQDKYESFSEISSSPQHPAPEEPRIKAEPFDKPFDKSFDKPLDLKTKPDKPTTPKTMEKGNQVCLDKQSLEIKIDANTILPDDHFDDDKLFMNSLIPLFKKMNDDTRLLCRIEVLKIIRYALQGHKSFEALKMAEDSFFKDRMSGILKEEVVEKASEVRNDASKLNMTTRSADGSRPVRKRRIRSPSPLPMPTKRRGPGRPRKVRPPPSDSDEEAPKNRRPKFKGSPDLTPPLMTPSDDVPMADMDDSLSKATSVDQLSAPVFMKMYNLARTEFAPALTQVPIKTEPNH